MENSTIIAIIVMVAIIVALIFIIKYYLPEKATEIGTPELLDNLVKANFSGPQEVATEVEE